MAALPRVPPLILKKVHAMANMSLMGQHPIKFFKLTAQDINNENNTGQGPINRRTRSDDPLVPSPNTSGQVSQNQ